MILDTLLEDHLLLKEVEFYLKKVKTPAQITVGADKVMNEKVFPDFANHRPAAALLYVLKNIVSEQA